MPRTKIRFTLKKKHKNSHYRGVYKVSNRVWNTMIHIDGEKQIFGPYKTEITAAKKYDVKALEYFGESATTNFSLLKKRKYNEIEEDEEDEEDEEIEDKDKEDNEETLLEDELEEKKKLKIVRKKFPVVTRNKICARQGWRCNFCNNLFGDVFIVDHIVPLFLRGYDKEFNLQSLCPSCDKFKTSYIDYKILKPHYDERGKIEIPDVIKYQVENYHKMDCSNPEERRVINCNRFITNNITNGKHKEIEFEVNGVKIKISI